MKGVFETYLLILFGMAFTLLGFSMVEITMKYNGARLYQESIVSLIERHNRYDSDIDSLIESSPQKCHGCTFKVSEFNDKYMVIVNFDIAIRVINFKNTGVIKSLTQGIN